MKQKHHKGSFYKITKEEEGRDTHSYLGIVLDGVCMIFWLCFVFNFQACNSRGEGVDQRALLPRGKQSLLSSGTFLVSESRQGQALTQLRLWEPD